jgi:hypothetical protein
LPNDMRGPPPPPMPPKPRPMPIGANDAFGTIEVDRSPAPPIGAAVGLRIFGVTALAFAVATFLLSLIVGPLPVRSRRIVGPLLSEPVVFTVPVPVTLGPSYGGFGRPPPVGGFGSFPVVGFGSFPVVGFGSFPVVGFGSRP